MAMPDPNDRSKNKPDIKVKRSKVIDIYNKETGENAQRFTLKRQKKFCKIAKKAGWDKVEFSVKNDCTLTNTRVKNT